MVYRIYVEKKPELANEAAGIYSDLSLLLGIEGLSGVRLLSRYDVESGDIEAALEKLEDAVEGRFSPLNYVTKEQVETEIARLKSN